MDFSARELTVGKSKTDFGTGRVIPLNARAYAVLEFWASNFQEPQASDYVFPSERYGAARDDFKACAYQTDPTEPIGRWKEAWEAAKIRSGVQCRFHDLRHTGCTRMLEAGVPFPVLRPLATTAKEIPDFFHHPSWLVRPLPPNLSPDQITWAVLGKVAYKEPANQWNCWTEIPCSPTPPVISKMLAFSPEVGKLSALSYRCGADKLACGFRPKTAR